jgi:signal transduction histidine kinase
LHLPALPSIPASGSFEFLVMLGEKMRSDLVGVNAKLRTEMAERERLEVHRQAPESRLRRRQSLDAVGTLASGVAHEFNNTLVPIMLLAQSVLDALPLDSPSREDCLHSPYLTRCPWTAPLARICSASCALRVAAKTSSSRC